MEDVNKGLVSDKKVEQNDVDLVGTDEQTIKFNVISDRINFTIQDKESGEKMCVISGYDLNVDFNMNALKSVDDIETCVGGIAEMFRGIIIDLLLNKNDK